jgi:phage/plasmid-like protein (TIGR03299 family)
MPTPAFAVTNDLSWTVSKRPVFFQRENGSLAECPDRCAIVRDDVENCLGFVSPNYETMQNSDLLKLVQPLVDEGLLTIENMGYLNHGSRVFAQAKLNQEYNVIGEDYKGYVTLLNSHNGSTAVSIGSTMTRVICGNTFTAAYSDISERYRHSAGVTDRVLESTFVLDYVNGAMKTYADYVEKMAGARCTGAQFKTFIEEVYQKPIDSLRDSFVQQLNNLFYNGKGNEGKSFYDCFNACTEYASNFSRKTSQGRFQYAQFGQGARVNNRAMRVALEMAGV